MRRIAMMIALMSLFVGLGVLSDVEPAMACSCATPPPMAAVSFEGRVVEHAEGTETFRFDVEKVRFGAAVDGIVVHIAHNHERGDVKEVNTCAALDESLAVGSRLAVEAYEAKGEATRMLFANLCGGKVNILTTVSSVDDVGGGPAIKSAPPIPAAEGNADSGTVPRGALLVGGLAVAVAGLAIVRRRRIRRSAAPVSVSPWKTS